MKYFFIALIFMLLLFGCGAKDKSDDKDEYSIKRDLLVDKIRKEYKILTENDTRNFRYTIQYAEAFIDSSYLFVIEPFWGIDDFLNNDGKSYVRFSSLFPTIYFNIECETNNFNKLFNIFSKNEYKEILLVLKIDDIKKMFLTANPQNDEVESYIELEYSSSFMANGRLITYRLINQNE